MEIFTITEVVWDDNQGEMVDTGKIIGYRAVSTTGRILGKGESTNEAIENALIAMYSNSDQRTN